MILAGIPTEFRSPTIGPGGIPVSIFSTTIWYGAISPGFAALPASVFFSSVNRAKEFILSVETSAG